MPAGKDIAETIPQAVYSSMTDSRIRDPGLPLRLAKKRARRESLTKDGRLTLLAVDHVARMVTSIGEDLLRMADRRDLLGRALRVIACSPFDGLLGSPDVIDELFILESSASRKFLDGKLIIGSANRGGLSGTAFELDDRITGFDAKGIARMRLDGGKFLLRMDPAEPASLRTLEYCVSFLRECEESGIPVFLELLPVIRKGGSLVVVRDTDTLARLVGVATALGNSSSRIWLKLPYVGDFATVAKATTCPILLLGGVVGGGVDELFGQIAEALRAGPNVRGVLMGRNVLYPKSGDPRGMAFAVNAMVHHGADVEKAKRVLERESWKKCGVFDG